jgi:hypothetical protein
VAAHVDQRCGFADALEGALEDRFGLADQGDDRAVRGGAGVDVQQADAVDAGDGGGDPVDDRAVAALAEVGNTLDDRHCRAPGFRDGDGSLASAPGKPAGGHDRPSVDRAGGFHASFCLSR